LQAPAPEQRHILVIEQSVIEQKGAMDKKVPWIAEMVQ
jgi:hypothetical protein